MCSLLVTRYIQESTPIPGVGSIDIYCVTAPSDPPVRCDATISCDNSTAVSIRSTGIAVYMTTLPCNIILSVSMVINGNPEILDQEIFINVVPLLQPTTVATTTSWPFTNILPTGENFRYTYIHYVKALL